MPERPDLEYVVAVLEREVVGSVIASAAVQNPIVMRVSVEGTPDELLRGFSIASVTRQSHFVRIGVRQGSLQREIIVSPMLAGVFDLAKAGAKRLASTAFCLTFDDRTELRYLDNKQMGKVYLLAAGDEGRVPNLAHVGLNVLDRRQFTKAAFRKAAAARRDQVRVFLMDKRALDAMGNAYADEVLFAARVHPKAWVKKLDDDQLDRLYEAIHTVLRDATRTIKERKPPLRKKIRDFLKVRGRAGEPCPRCETKLRKVRVRGFDAHFCPRCQPDSRGSQIVDWRKI